jgi:hypothetical protein
MQHPRLSLFLFEFAITFALSVRVEGHCGRGAEARRTALLAVGVFAVAEAAAPVATVVQNLEVCENEHM